MIVRTKALPALAVAVVAGLAVPAAALAQSAGSTSMGNYQSGYGGSRYTTSQAQTGTTRDANGNRLIVNGIIQQGASSYSQQSGGVASAYSGAGGGNSNGQAIGGSTAIGNNLNVVVQGNHNTVIVNSRQTNTGDVNAGTHPHRRRRLRRRGPVERLYLGHGRFQRPLCDTDRQCAGHREPDALLRRALLHGRIRAPL
jgi:holdfast attachment protein HfaA